jgi:hypothetical protein
MCSLFGVTFGIDTWDLSTPTTSGHPIFNELSCIFKTSYNGNHSLYKNTEDQYNVKVYNYPMFHYKELLKYELQNCWCQSSKKNLLFFSGIVQRSRGNRPPWVKYLKSNNQFRVFEDPWELGFIEEAKKSKWGLVLEGRGGKFGDAKNRRTIIYASWGYPLILNFQPHYHIPFIPDVDYVYIREPKDIDRINNIDPEPYAKRSKLFYDNCLSPEANAQYIIDMVSIHRR